MPAMIVVTELEVETIKAAGDIGELNGHYFSYDPSKTMEIIAKIHDSGHDGAERLAGRLADILGRHFVKDASFSGLHSGGVAGPNVEAPTVVVSESVLPKRRKAPSPTPEPVQDRSAD